MLMRLQVRADNFARRIYLYITGGYVQVKPGFYNLMQPLRFKE